MSRLGLDSWGSGVRFSARARHFFFLQHDVHTGCAARPASYSSGTGSFFLSGKEICVYTWNQTFHWHLNNGPGSEAGVLSCRIMSKCAVGPNDWNRFGLKFSVSKGKASQQRCSRKQNQNKTTATTTNKQTNTAAAALIWNYAIWTPSRRSVSSQETRTSVSEVRESQADQTTPYYPGEP